MPIRPELRPFYGKEWRTVTRPRILARAGDKCEQCGKPNHTRVWTITAGTAMVWSLADEDDYWHNHLGEKVSVLPRSDGRVIFVVLTIAHLNHVPGDDRAENLKALCCWCHLHHDVWEHVRNARVTRVLRKDAARPLLKAAE
jgi:hypothetical protein